MKRKTNHHINRLLINPLFFLSFCVFLCTGCSSFSKVNWDSEKLYFKIDWTYSYKKKSNRFSSLVFLQKKDLLRIDIFQNMIGVVGSLILKDQNILIQNPFKKEYYEGIFDSKQFFPDQSSFPMSWLGNILRIQPDPSWICQKKNEKLTECKTAFFKINWKYKQNQIHEIHIQTKKKIMLKAQIKHASSGDFSSRIFSPSLESWKRKQNPLFFKKTKPF